jgi:hypothetical protein
MATAPNSSTSASAGAIIAAKILAILWALDEDRQGQLLDCAKTLIEAQQDEDMDGVTVD